MTTSPYILSAGTSGATSPSLLAFQAADLSGFAGLTGHFMLGNGGLDDDAQLRNIATDGASGNLTRIGTPVTSAETALLNATAGFDTGALETTDMTVALAMKPVADTFLAVIGNGSTTAASAMAMWLHLSSIRIGCLDGTPAFVSRSISVAALDTAKYMVAVGSFSATGLSIGYRSAGAFIENIYATTGRTLSGANVRIGAGAWAAPYDSAEDPVSEVAIFNTSLGATDRAALALDIETNLVACGLAVN